MAEVNVHKFLEGASEDLVTALEENIEGMVDSHLEAWKDRYWRKSVEDMSFDLNVNHDISLEIEHVTNKLGRELEEGEYEVVETFFNESVLNEFR